MNYTTLVQNIKDFMEDDGAEFSNAVDTFIDLTELRLSRDLKIPAFRRRQLSAFSSNDRSDNADRYGNARTCKPRWVTPLAIQELM